MLNAIETPDEFIELMDSIWDGELHISHYDKWHNARDVARELKLPMLYGARHDGNYGYDFRCPNGDKIWISTDGGMVALKQRKMRYRHTRMEVVNA
jgi:hypothetical protein